MDSRIDYQEVSGPIWDEQYLQNYDYKKALAELGKS